MPQSRPQLGAVMLVAVVAAWIGLLVPPALAKKAPVERTGQTTSYADGDDGDIQAGVPWPTPRFTDKRNGTVKDNLTGLIWLKNANCFVGGVTWAQALTDANSLADGSCGLSDGSVAGAWRLPNVKELQSLVDFGNANPALPSGHPFSGVQASHCWSSTTRPDAPGVAWLVHLHDDGRTDGAGKDATALVWPVQGRNLLTILPNSDAFATTQRFDLSLIVEALGRSVVGGRATLNGTDVTTALARCVIPGTLLTGGQTFRCPGLTGGLFGLGTHTLDVVLNLSDGSSISDTVIWEVLGNTEP